MFASKVKQTILISTMLFPLQAIGLDELQEPILHQHRIRLSVLRLDKIHPIASGNKLFKLHYFLQEAIDKQLPLLTYGGAYSNHLAATAYACKQLGIGCTAIVRGEKPALLSHTLQACEAFGMQLNFVPRSVYAHVAAATVASGNIVNVPEGGYHPEGAKGAALILESLPHNNFSHICTATGTATTLAGLLLASAPTQKVFSFSSLKG
ncbi:MAG: pyridoxal-phosphate dependent enzyme, partial [Chitinophagaceae bacterium]